MNNTVQLRSVHARTHPHAQFWKFLRTPLHKNRRTVWFWLLTVLWLVERSGDGRNFVVSSYARTPVLQANLELRTPTFSFLNRDMFDLRKIYELNLKTGRLNKCRWICKLRSFLNREFTVLRKELRCSRLWFYFMCTMEFGHYAACSLSPLIFMHELTMNPLLHSFKDRKFKILSIQSETTLYR